MLLERKLQLWETFEMKVNLPTTGVLQMYSCASVRFFQTKKRLKISELNKLISDYINIETSRIGYRLQVLCLKVRALPAYMW